MDTETQNERLRVISNMIRNQHSAGLFHMMYWKRLATKGERLMDDTLVPECGTVACIGGTCELAYPHLVRPQEREANVGFILGIDYECARALTYPPGPARTTTGTIGWSWITVDHALLALQYAVELSRTTFDGDKQYQMMYDYWQHLYEQHQGCPPSL